MTRPRQLERSSIESLAWDLTRGESRDGVLCVKRSRTRCVLRLGRGLYVEGGGVYGSGRAVFVKRYLNPYLRRRVGSLFGISKARSEAETLVALLGRGVHVPRVVGWVATWWASYLATEAIEGVVALGDALERVAGSERRSLWEQAGRFTAWLWSKGVYHPDFFEDHLCVTTSAPPSERAAELPLDVARFVLLDVDGVVLRDGPPAERLRLLSTMQMLKSCGPERGSRDDRLAFVAAAWGVDPAVAERDVLPRLREVARGRGAVTHLE